MPALLPLLALLLSTFLLSVVEAATPAIVHPAKGAVIAPNATFKFEYHSIADYGVSSYNFTCWLFTAPPAFFKPSESFAEGYHLGRFSQSNYPANASPHNPAPPDFTMPDLSHLGGWGVGSHASHAKVYFTVIEEYGDGKPSLGYRMSLSVNEIYYNGTRR
ncbi:hypothetical protein C8F04DRAFT_1228981 [Mycena alexandri]|uniref:Uncharacterized protein n=1 Tax=Mycena alexandri TaxID=1745969 RepID=A0AAD6TDV0_9AGAR|nr:hypothetical protein C8F04DRAFT_1228981 [Mycena alexandri]